jgi:hypothetical protein
MSRGPGCVERAIIAALTPNNALTTKELCERCYDEPIIKKHRVAVLRALKRVMDRRQDIATLTTEGLGSQVVAYWRYDVTSYAMARLKAEGGNYYRSNDPRLLPHQISDENKLKASLKRGGEHHRHVVKGGAWWDHVQLAIAVRDGDHHTAKALRAKAARRRLSLAS